MVKVAVLGLGAMGAGMAANLLKSGYLVAAWNRSEERRKAFEQASGFRATGSLQDAVAAADIVLTCVSKDDDLREVIATALPHLKAGALIIDCSTVALTTAQTIATDLASNGQRFIDAPVSGGKEGAINGVLAIMVGGQEEDFESALPVFESIGSRWQRMGDVGAGQATKAVNQIMAAGINQAVSEAMAFAVRNGLPVDKVVDVVGNGAAGNWLVNHRGVSMTAGRFEPGFKIALHQKDLGICQAMAKASAAPTGVIDKTMADYERLISQGFGDEDISALYRLKSSI